METTKELRIGNLVEDHNGVHYVIYAISRNSVIVDPPFGWFDISEIKPIPLTEEWLVKFGFEKSIFDDTYIEANKNDKCYRFDNPDECYYISYGKQNSMFCSVDYGGLKYINYAHQLQNLFYSLTGEELY